MLLLLLVLVVFVFVFIFVLVLLLVLFVLLLLLVFIFVLVLVLVLILLLLELLLCKAQVLTGFVVIRVASQCVLVVVDGWLVLLGIIGKVAEVICCQFGKMGITSRSAQRRGVSMRLRD